MKINSLQDFLNFNDQKDIKLKVENKNTFGSFLMEAMDNVNNAQKISEKFKDMLAIGELDNLHDLTIASEKADVALQITLGIRNKIVDAYKEILRIQI